jgi:16S rRNA processing protein RimM
MRKEDCYLLGKITRRHGLAGNVILKLDTDQPELYNKLESIFVEINGLLVPFFIEKSSWSKLDALNIAFKNSSEALVDQSLGKCLSSSLYFQNLQESNFITTKSSDNIHDENDNDCGVIRSVNDQTAQVYFITNLDGKEVVIPIIKDWILK